MRKLIFALAILGAIMLKVGGGAWWIADNWGYTNITNGSNDGKNYGYSVPAIAIGDADNDGLNETVIGYKNGTYELRMYEYSSGTWTETNITDETSGIYAVAIGDVNNDSKNEIVIGMQNDSLSLDGNSIRIYENKSGGWIETNISTISRDVTVIALGYASNKGINGIMAGFTNTSSDGYNVKFYDNVSGGWRENNVSNNPYSVAGVAVGNGDSVAGNETYVGFVNSPNGLKMYKNTTGKWVETNISKIDITNQTWPTTTSNLLIKDVDNNGKQEIVMGMSYNDGYTVINQVKNYYNIVSSVWIATVMAGGLTYMPSSIGVGDYYGNGRNATVYKYSTFNIIGITNSSTFWQQTLIGVDSSGVMANALQVADINDDGKKEIIMGGSLYSQPYNVYSVLEYHYITPATGGVAATDLFCVALGKNKRFCSGNGNDYLCIKDNCVVI